MPDPARTGSPLPELTLGRPRPIEPATRTEPAPEPARRATSDAELPAVEARCRLKAEGLRWAATRRRLKDEGADFRVEIAPKDREILDRAGDIGCYLWMNTPDFAVPGGPGVPGGRGRVVRGGGRGRGPGPGDAARRGGQPGVLRAGPRPAGRGPVGVAGGDRPDRRPERPGPVSGSTTGCVGWPLGSKSTSAATCGWTTPPTRRSWPSSRPASRPWTRGSRRSGGGPRGRSRPSTGSATTPS